MPLLLQSSVDHVFVYILVLSRSSGAGTFAMYSGHISVSGFAWAVQHSCIRGLSYLTGADGPCYCWSGRLDQLRRVLPLLGYACFSCGRIVADLQCCDGCKFARYCSARCQRHDWHRHRLQCGQLQYDHRARRIEDGEVVYGFLSAYDFVVIQHLMAQTFG